MHIPMPRKLVSFILRIARVVEARVACFGQHRRTAAWMGAAATLMFVGTTRSEVYFNDSTVSVVVPEGLGSRNCTVRLKPTITFGGSIAPHLILETKGQSQLSFGIENPEQYSNVVVVHHGMRVPLAKSGAANVDTFQSTSLATALKSETAFFVTATRDGGRGYVSSRYERIDFDKILTKMEAACAFDAESLLADLRPRLSAERSLSLPKSDLTLIRWALLKRYDANYGSRLSGPDIRPELSPVERRYLKQYARENELTQSRYLTAEVAERLLAEGKEIAAKAAELVFSLDVCNTTRTDAWVAVSARKFPDGDGRVQGWWPVRPGSCLTLGKFPKEKFFVTAIVPPTRSLFGAIIPSGGLLGWNGTERLTTKCVNLYMSFEKPDTSERSCQMGEMMIGFHELHTDGSSYTWSIKDIAVPRSLSPDVPYFPPQPMWTPY